MSSTLRESIRGDGSRHASTQNVIVPTEQRSQGLHAADEAGELSGGAASSQRTTRQSDLAPGLASWDTRTHEPAGEDASHVAPAAPADFKPFFALVEDPVTGEYHHPEVHYVFSDDEDQGVLTSAALQAIEKEDNTLQEGGVVEERVAVIDMDYDGRTVLGISSLSPEWQALRTEIWQAPGRADKVDNKQGGDRGLMLRVSGKEASASKTADLRDAGDVDILVEKFGHGLDSLDEVLGEDEVQGHEQASHARRSQRPGSLTE